MTYKISRIWSGAVEYPGMFRLHNADQRALVQHQRLDYEVIQVLNITVDLSDNNIVSPGVGSMRIVVHVVNFNEAVSLASPSTGSVPENSPEGTPCYVAAYTDVDGPTEGAFFRIANGSNLPFALHTDTGVMTTTRVFNFEQEDAAGYAVAVEVSDRPFNSGATDATFDSLVVTIFITDVNDAPLLVCGDGTVVSADDACVMYAPENATAGYQIGSLAFFDEDDDPVSATVIALQNPYSFSNVSVLGSADVVVSTGGRGFDYEVVCCTRCASDGTGQVVYNDTELTWMAAPTGFLTSACCPVVVPGSSMTPLPVVHSPASIVVGSDLRYLLATVRLVDNSSLFDPLTTVRHVTIVVTGASGGHVRISARCVRVYAREGGSSSMLRAAHLGEPAWVHLRALQTSTKPPHSLRLR